MRIIAATQNKHKLEEIYQIIKDFDMELVSQAEVGLGNVDVEENGTTCEENSKIKAEAICKLSGEPAIADDTGLFVDALNGEPGVNTARYAGVHGDDAANRKKLLENLKDVPFEKRTAAFVTVITLIYPDGKTIVARGECKGHISEKEIGDRGFGYDSVFIPLESDKTFAELPAEFKNSVSHRARALQRLAQLL
ncbi:MAG: RdgB/HAM1 family non-canonical purine NTP pyrophosphatase [Clostridia bacterium]|nr:RdgB/HAM1 family non-canonical purine NTP pyrophosphatase [Clostridia bacterium]